MDLFANYGDLAGKAVAMLPISASSLLGVNSRVTQSLHEPLRVSSFATRNNHEKTRSQGSGIFVVNHLTSNWNHILEEINQWYDLLRGKLAVNYIPVGSSS